MSALEAGAYIGRPVAQRRRGPPYMVIGGIANLVWGVPRATMDVDVTVWVEEERIPTLFDRLGEHLRLLPEEPVAFVERTRVLAAETTEGIRIDIIFGQLPFEEQAIQRTRPIDFGGVPVLICSPEDLIIHKIISERPQDREDVRGIIHRLGPQLDREYTEPILRGLEEDLGRADLISFFEDCLER